MTAIAGITLAGFVRTPTRARGASAGFHVPDDAPVDTPAPIAAARPPSLLALQEADAEPVQDREARRHGKAMLDVLTRLQQAILTGGGADTLDSLANLVRAAPVPSDPRLAAVQRAVLVRAAVELARARAEASV
jgi:hypothetical protein